MQSQSFAARAGRWSAQHRKKAILGWFAFVILATVLGGMVGTKTLADEDTGNGESRRGDQIIEAAGFPDQTGETVLVQGKDGLKVGDPEFTAVVKDVITRLEPDQGRREHREPARPRVRRQRLRRRPLGARELRAARRRGPRRRRPSKAPLATVAALQKEHPEVQLGQFGDASAEKEIGEAFEKDFQKAEVLSLPITLRDPAGRVRRARRGRPAAAARRDRGDGHDRPARPDQPAACAGGELVERGAAGRPGRRRRLLHVLPPARDGGARLRPHVGRRARGGRGYLRPRGAGLRPHRDVGDGRHVPRRQRGLRVVRHRHDHRRRRRDARIGDRAARDALVPLAQGLDREGTRAVGRQAAPQDARRVAGLGRDPRPRAQAPAASPRVLAGGLLAGAVDPGVLDAHDQPGRHRAAARPRGDAGLRQDRRGVPGRRRPGGHGRQGGRRHDARGAGRDRRPAAAGDRDRQAARAGRHRRQPRQDGRDGRAGGRGHRHRRGIGALARGAARRRGARHRRAS